MPDSLVAGATLLSGLYDLEPVRLGHPNEWLKLGAADVAALSPLLHMPEHAVPLVVSYAPSETHEFKRQSEAYMAAAWRAVARSASCQCQAPVITISCSGSPSGKARSRLRSSKPWGSHERHAPGCGSVVLAASTSLHPPVRTENLIRGNGAGGS